MPRGLWRDDAPTSDTLPPTVEPNCHVEGSLSSYTLCDGLSWRGRGSASSVRHMAPHPTIDKGKAPLINDFGNW